MAITNPNLEDGFDLNGSNLLALTTALQDDGFSQNEIPKSGHINTVFKELYRYVQFLKETGISQWDNATSYKSGARIMRDEVLYKSLSDANQGNDPLSAPSFWQVDEWRQQTTTHNITVDGDYTLTADQNSFGRIVITDTGVVISGSVNIIVDDLQKSFIAVNETAQDITFRTSVGTGILVKAGTIANLYNDSVNIISGIGGTFTTDVIFKAKITSDQVTHTSLNTTTEAGAIGGSLNIASLVKDSTGTYTGTLIKALDDYTLSTVVTSINRAGSANRAMTATLLSNTQFQIVTNSLSPVGVIDEKFSIAISGGFNV